MVNWPLIGEFFAKLLIKLAPLFVAFKAGTKMEEVKQLEEELEAMKDAKAIHERIDNDPAERERVRDIFR